MKLLKYLAWLLLVGCGTREVQTIVIRGSDTEVNLVLRLAETFMEQDPNVSIAVTGGGSGTGIAALINKKTDIANSSRAFKDSELALAKAREVDVVPIVFAMDALSFIVHPSLPVDELSTAQIRSIFTGTTTDWSELGGPDLGISLYGRQSNSGTFSFIQQQILRADYAQSMKQMNGTAQIIESIKNDIAGIGYVGVGYVVDKTGKQIDGVKVLAVTAVKGDAAISPLESENIINGSYPIVRPLYQYLDGQPTGKLADFLRYELSARGTEMIIDNGYFPIGKHYQRQNQQILDHE
ncbi:MAG: phosphate ABC transporter substrate-binding protein [Bacteroidota bacterium]